MATPRRGLGRVLVTLLLVVGFVLGPVAGRVAAVSLSGDCHGMATIHAAHGRAAGHADVHRAAAADRLPADSADDFEVPRLSAGFTCLVHCSWLPAPAGVPAPDRSPLVIEPRRPSAEPASCDVEPAVPPPRFERIDAI